MIIIRLLFLLLLPLCLQGTEDKTLSHYVLVSVAPHRFFVQKIAGDTVFIGLLVPAGDSAHTYEPTPKQMIQASKADAWFQIGEPFEKRASSALLSRNPTLQLIDLRQGLELIYDHSCAHCRNRPDSADPHIWLSSRLAKRQAQTIAEALSRLYPENRDLYMSNLGLFINELTELDNDIKNMFKDKSPKTIVVSHPAYAYFCRDYGLKQISIEFEGRDPSPQQLTMLLQELKTLSIKTIYTQPQYSVKGAQLIAQQLDVKTVSLNPYSEDYLNTMRAIGKNFSEP